MTMTIHVNMKQDAAVTDILKQLPMMVTNYSTIKVLLFHQWMYYIFV